MAKERLNNLKKMKSIAEKKSSYGINQVRVEFSAKHNIVNDKKAVAGKRVLREKIYSQV